MRKKIPPRKAAPSAPGKRDFLVLLAAAPAEAWILDDGTRIAGFYQSFGVSARTPSTAEAIARNAMKPERIRVIKAESVRAVDRAILDSKILSRGKISGGPIWYRSGKVLFQDATLVEPEQ